MSGPLSPLPRGTSQTVGEEAPVATARWATPEEIAAHAYQDGDLWLGSIPVPHAEARDTLDRLYDLRTAIAGDPDLSPDWQAKVCARIDAYIEALSCTAALPIGVNDDRHAITLGSTRAGKGTSAIIPNLCRWPGPVVCIDPKGENAKITAARRGFGSKYCNGLGQSVAILDPYNTTGLAEEVKAAWNPLDRIDLEDPNAVDQATSIAESLIVRTDPEAEHWDSSARALIKALILYVAVVHQGRPDRNLITVYRYLRDGAVAQLAADRGGMENEGDPDPFTYLLHLMLRRSECDGIIAGAARTLMSMGERERGSVLSTARRNLEFLERKAMQSVLSHSSFSIDQLKSDPAGLSLYLCLPPQRMHDCGRWLRLMISSCLERMYELNKTPATGHPVLFLLEEFASLQHMEIIEHAAGYAAGFDVKLWIILQDLAQLKRYYPQGWETFVGNAGVIQAFGNSDAMTLAFLSKKLGETELIRTLKNTTSSLTASINDAGDSARLQSVLFAGGPVGQIVAPFTLLADPHVANQGASTQESWTQQLQKTALLQPDEIERLFRREAMTQIVHIKGEPPFALSRETYHDNPRFVGLYDPVGEPKCSKSEMLQHAERQRTDQMADRERLIAEAAAFMRYTAACIIDARRIR